MVVSFFGEGYHIYIYAYVYLCSFITIFIFISTYICIIYLHYIIILSFGSGSKFGLSRGVPHPLCYKPCRGQVVSYVCRAVTLNPIFLVGFCKGLG